MNITSVEYPKYFDNEKEMTGGGLMQLVAYGAQDVYLTSNPPINFLSIPKRRAQVETHVETITPKRNIEVEVEATTSTQDLKQFEYAFGPEKESKTDLSKYKCNVG
jgi:hypothetical protein